MGDDYEVLDIEAEIKSINYNGERLQIKKKKYEDAMSVTIGGKEMGDRITDINICIDSEQPNKVKMEMYDFDI